jgi:predicted secreted protein
MSIGSVIAIYFLFFVFTAFLLLPFGVRTDEEVGMAPISGQADSAPHRFNLQRHLIRAGLISAILFGLFYLNYATGWIRIEDLDFYN